MNLGVFLADGDISMKFAIFGPKENTFFPQTKNSPFLTQIAVHVHRVCVWGDRATGSRVRHWTEPNVQYTAAKGNNLVQPVRSRFAHNVYW